jgi:hypothetical protein
MLISTLILHRATESDFNHWQVLVWHCGTTLAGFSVMCKHCYLGDIYLELGFLFNRWVKSIASGFSAADVC